MSSELNMKDLQMKTYTEKIQTLLKGLDKSKRVELDLSEISSLIRNFQNALDSAQLESKSSSGPQKADTIKSLREHKNTLKDLTSEYEKRKSTSNSKLLMSGASSSSSASSSSGDASSLMKHGLAVQDKSTDSLNRALRAIRDAKSIGVDTVAKLETDTHRMAALFENLYSIDTTLERSTKTIKRIARNN